VGNLQHSLRETVLARGFHLPTGYPATTLGLRLGTLAPLARWLCAALVAQVVVAALHVVEAVHARPNRLRPCQRGRIDLGRVEDRPGVPGIAFAGLGRAVVVGDRRFDDVGGDGRHAGGEGGADVCAAWCVVRSVLIPLPIRCTYRSPM